jgi:hypothetical protein
LLFFSESGCKGKNFKAYLPNIFGSFFYFSFFSLSSSSLLSKGRQKEKGRKKTGHRFLKEECQLALLSFSKAGAKVRTLKHNFQMFRKFFSFFFSKAEVPKETYGKEEKNGSLPLRFTVRMSKHRRLRSRKRMQK